VTMRPGYVCTIQLPNYSPYYSHYHNRNKWCDYVDLALITSFAVWYDFWCVAPLEFIQCVQPPANMTDIERSPPVPWYNFPLKPRPNPMVTMMTNMPIPGLSIILGLLGGAGPSNPPPYCKNGHTLTQMNTGPASYTGGSYRCDFCGTSGDFAAGFHHCNECGNFDCCPSCFAAGKANTKP